jgi:branched-chain amino acid transport system substrate-binding protein
VHLKQVTETHENMEQSKDAAAFSELFREKTGKTWYADHTRTMFLLLAKAMTKAGNADPKKVALALEGLTLDGPVGEIQMRADDHQIQSPMVVSEMDKNAPKKFIYNGQDFGIGFRTVAKVSREEAVLPTTCQMKRP